MYELIDFIVKSLVDNKEEVLVEQAQEGKVTIFNVTVAQSDMGHLIGKQGKMAEAIRTVVKAMDSRKPIRIKFNAK